MGKVYLARDEVLHRNVALKVLREQYAESEEFVERFRREARSAAALSHPNVVSVYDLGRSQDGTYIIAMEYVPGGTLKDRVDVEGPLDPGAAAELGLQVAEALGVAHERGVIHRDVKPQNILFTASGEAKVADFGIARAASAATISQTGRILGTARYMSPEQAMGKSVGPASDLYSLGVVLYEALTGETPFEAETLVAIAVKHAKEPPRPPKEVNPGVPEGMNALVLKLLAKKPEDRYADSAELAEDLRRVRDGLPPLALGGPASAEGNGTNRAVVSGPPAPPVPADAGGNVRPREGVRGRLFRWPQILAALAAVLVALLGALASGDLSQDRDLLQEEAALGSGSTVAEPDASSVGTDEATTDADSDTTSGRTDEVATKLLASSDETGGGIDEAGGGGGVPSGTSGYSNGDSQPILLAGQEEVQAANAAPAPAAEAAPAAQAAPTANTPRAPAPEEVQASAPGVQQPPATKVVTTPVPKEESPAYEKQAEGEKEQKKVKKGGGKKQEGERLGPRPSPVSGRAASR